MTALGEVLRPSKDPVRVEDPATARLISVKLHGKGAVQRTVGDGKAPKPFTGNRGRAGQFVFSRIWARRGAMALVPVELDGVVVTNEFPLFDVDSARLDARYLNRYVQTPSFLAALERVSAGASGQNRVKEAAFLGLDIPLPPLPEQHRIGSILDHADTLRARRQGGRRLYLELIESQHDRHTREATEVTIATLLREGALTVHKDGNHGSVYPRAEEFVPSGVPFLTAKAVRDDGTFITEAVDHLNETKARQLRVGWIRRNDVLLSHNASVGKVAVYEGQFGEALIGTSLTSFRSNPALLDPRFLAASLRSSFFQRQLTSNMAQTTRNQVPITAQRELRVKWVGLAQQRAFVTIAEEINARLRDEWRSAAAYEELFASLQSRAFRGEL
ncbi:restriction endonuclease subunit S [Aquipuribacter sp. SD81]|uniref:restriction endonuclease subunit S n=1 Tax=Aquipuribacter sp. SD81 TaxID=3127703 RepID=UPI00301B5505